MMHSSWKYQKQTHILSKLRRSAPGTARPPVSLARSSKKRLAFISLGIVAGIGFPTLVFASQQSPSGMGDSSAEDYRPDQPTPPVTSSTDEEVFSSSIVDLQVGPSGEASSEIVGEATINGEVIPLTNGSNTTRYVEGDSNSVDVDISVKNGETSTSISSSSSTVVHIESQSSSSEDTNQTRGSPRR